MQDRTSCGHNVCLCKASRRETSPQACYEAGVSVQKQEVSVQLSPSSPKRVNTQRYSLHSIAFVIGSTKSSYEFPQSHRQLQPRLDHSKEILWIHPIHAPSICLQLNQLFDQLQLQNLCHQYGHHPAIIPLLSCGTLISSDNISSLPRVMETSKVRDNHITADGCTTEQT